MKLSCLTPYPVYIPETKDYIDVPCGKCPVCAARRSSGWSFRLMEQEKVSSSAYFVTLTYDSKHIPISRNGFKTLDKTDLQKFIKRLRKAHDNRLGRIKYYAVGEYGSKTRRPHYHIILFNARKQDIENSWALDGKPIGEIHIGSVSGASIGYTLKYIHKPKWRRKHRNDDRESPTSLISKDWGRVI